MIGTRRTGSIITARTRSRIKYKDSDEEDELGEQEWTSQYIKGCEERREPQGCMSRSLSLYLEKQDQKGESATPLIRPFLTLPFLNILPYQPSLRQPCVQTRTKAEQTRQKTTLSLLATSSIPAPTVQRKFLERLEV